MNCFLFHKTKNYFSINCFFMNRFCFKCFRYLQQLKKCFDIFSAREGATCIGECTARVRNAQCRRNQTDTATLPGRPAGWATSTVAAGGGAGVGVRCSSHLCNLIRTWRGNSVQCTQFTTGKKKLFIQNYYYNYSSKKTEYHICYSPFPLPRIW